MIRIKPLFVILFFNNHQGGVNITRNRGVKFTGIYSDTTLLDADKLFDGSNLPLTVQVTGQWVSEYGLPMGFEAPKGKPEYSKVFRYTKIKVLESGREEKSGH